MKADKRSFKSTATWLLKLAFVGVLLTYLARKGLLSMDAMKVALSRWDLVVPALIIFYLNVFLGVWRWHLLLKTQGINVKFRRVLELSFVGFFFNIALPGAVTGDLVKAIYVGKEAPGLRAQAFGSILFDRIVGVSALVFVSAGALLMGVETFWGTTFFEAIEKLVLLIGAFVFVFYTFLFFWGNRFDPILKWGEKVKDQKSAVGSIIRTYKGIREFGTNRKVVLKAIGISIAIHLLVAYGILLFTRALGEEQISPVALFAVAPLGLLVTAIPVLPAGIGTGHAAFSALFNLIGSSRGADAFNIFVLFQLFLGAIGGLVYLRFKSKNAPLTDSEMTEAEMLTGAALAKPLTGDAIPARKS